MKNTLSFFRPGKIPPGKLTRTAILFFVLWCIMPIVNAQPAVAPCNLKSPWINTTGGYGNLQATRGGTGNISCAASSYGDETRLVDNNLTNTTNFSLTGVGCTVSYRVKDADNADTYPAGYYAGFKVSSAGLVGVSVASTVRIETWNNGSFVEGQDVVTSTLGVESSLVDGAGNVTLGYITSGAFDEIRINYDALVGLGYSGQVYYPVIEKFCKSTTPLVCNTVESPINNPAFPTIIDNSKTGLSSLVCTDCSISNAENIISSSTTDSATIILAISAGATASVAVKDVLDTFPANTFAGFTIKNPSLVNANVLSGLTVRTYFKGNLVESSGTNTLVSVSSSLLTGSGKQVVGFITTAQFDEVRLEISNLLPLLSTTNVFNAVVEKFCVIDTLPCNTQTPINNTGFATTVSNANTGITGVCVGCAVNDAYNVISPSNVDSATITLAASVAGSGSISVKDVLTDYPAGTFAGFTISNTSLVNANALSGLTVRTYLNGALQQSATAANALVSATSSLLTGTGRQVAGFVTTLPFDEVKLEINNLVNALSVTHVYNVVLEKFCPGPPVTCAGYEYLKGPAFPVIVNQQRTGVSGAVCALCTVNNPQNLVDADTTNTTDLVMTAGVLASASVSVRNVLEVYPTGTFAGFDVENTAVLGLGLLNSADITTYLNGVEQETGGGRLIQLKLLSATRQVVGFTTTLPFNEVKFTITGLVNVDLGTTRIRGAVVQGTSAAGVVPPALSSAVINGAAASNNCPSATVNLNSFITGTTPAGADLLWYTNATHTGATYATPATAGTGTYYAFYFDPLKGCYSLVTTPVNVVIIPCTKPDYNVAFLNVPVRGDVSVNDKIPAGTTYGTPTIVPGNPDNAVPVINSDGTYTFTPTGVGTYSFLVPVCAAAQTPPCPVELLVITSQYYTGGSPKSPPVANTDYAVTPVNTAVTINTLANDAAGTPGTSLASTSVTITDMNGAALGNTSKGGTVTTNILTGNTTYTPPSGFVGIDTIRYTVCDNGTPPLCSGAYQIVNVQPASAPNNTFGYDDFGQTFAGSIVMGNLITNDIDPQGDLQTIPAQTTVIPGKGTLIVTPAGLYTFTPAPGFTGPVDFGYAVCDASVCDSATLHILVKPFDPNPDENVTMVNIPVAGNLFTNDDIPAGSSFGTPTSIPGNPTGALPISTGDGKYIFVAPLPGVYQFLLPICSPAPTSFCKNETLTITVVDSAVGSVNNPIANPDHASVKGSATTPTPVTLNLKANDVVGNNNGTLGTPTATTGPLHGTAVIAPDGTMTYTPVAGYYGKDTVTYQVCETPSGLCISSIAVINVLAPDSPVDVAASDDNNYTVLNQGIVVPVGKGVLANDNTSGTGPLLISSQNTTISGKGTLVLNSDGSYTFNPIPGFIGNVDFGYQVCDGSMCDSATLHILVRPGIPLFSLKLKVLLQGPLLGNASGSVSTMRDNLRNSPFSGLNYVPSSNPYSRPEYSSKFTQLGDGFNTSYQRVSDSAAMFADKGLASLVDWVFIEIRNKNNPATVVSTRAALLQRDGTVVDIDGNPCILFPTVLSDNYYVAVRHRNHMGTMTANPLPASTFTCASAAVVDFTTMTNAQLWNNNGYDGLEQATLSDGKRALWAGNAFHNNKVKYQGGDNDRTELQDEVLTFGNNSTADINFDFAFGYFKGDINMDSKAKYQGSDNDRTILQDLIFSYLLNTTFDVNFDFFLEQLPF